MKAEISKKTTVEFDDKTNVSIEVEKVGNVSVRRVVFEPVEDIKPDKECNKCGCHESCGVKEENIYVEGHPGPEMDDISSIYVKKAIKERDEILKKAHKKADSIHRDAATDHKDIVQMARGEAETILSDAASYHKNTIHKCDEMIAKAKAEAEKIKRESMNVTINVTGTTGSIVEDINNALAEKMGIKNRI